MSLTQTSTQDGEWAAARSERIRSHLMVEGRIIGPLSTVTVLGRGLCHESSAARGRG